MATNTNIIGVSIPIGRLIARTARLSSPLILILLGLWLTGYLSFGPALVGLLIGLALGGFLAFSREARLQELESQLSDLVTIGPATSGGFEILAGDALPLLAQQVKDSLNRVRMRQDELDLTLTALLDALPDPLLLVRHDRVVERANSAAGRLLEHDSTGKPIEAAFRDPGLLAAIDDVLEVSDGAEINLQLAGPPWWSDRTGNMARSPCCSHQPA